ncbi:MAG: hypothetical protein LBC02_08920 [Planctomycetaceae bacterium]|jgi:hypothetical protein|nr:hypothetical protein [Planctomycetaceae bacterium]
MFKLIKDEIYFILSLCAIVAVPAGALFAFTGNEITQPFTFHFFAACTSLCFFIVPPFGMLFSIIAFFKKKKENMWIKVIRYAILFSLFLFHFLVTVIFLGGYLYHNYFTTQ